MLYWFVHAPDLLEFFHVCPPGPGIAQARHERSSKAYPKGLLCWGGLPVAGARPPGPARSSSMTKYTLQACRALRGATRHPTHAGAASHNTASIGARAAAAAWVAARQQDMQEDMHGEHAREDDSGEHIRRGKQPPALRVWRLGQWLQGLRPREALRLLANLLHCRDSLLAILLKPAGHM